MNLRAVHLGLSGSASAAAAGWRRRRLAAQLDRHPEWWLYPIAALGWAFLALHDLRGGHGATATAGPGDHGHHLDGSMASAEFDIGTLAVMTIAMTASMLALIGPSTRGAALRSVRRRRTGAVFDVAAGWAAVGLGVMALIGVFVATASAALGPTTMAVATLTVATGWHTTARRRRHTVGCHRAVLPPLDLRDARRMCRRHGIRLGADCWMSCGPMMATMAAASHSMLLTIPTFGVVWWERNRVAHHQRRSPVGAAVVLAAGLTWLLVGAR